MKTYASSYLFSHHVSHSGYHVIQFDDTTPKPRNRPSGNDSNVIISILPLLVSDYVLSPPTVKLSVTPTSH